jgi:hypothetical protein
LPQRLIIESFGAMLGELDGLQIEDLLMSLPVGRVGCHADGITYIVPINYVYEDDTKNVKKGIRGSITIPDSPQNCSDFRLPGTPIVNHLLN